MMVLAFIFLCLAAVCNAILNTLSHHYDTSIFRHFNRQFFDPEISWYNKYKDGIVSHGHKKWKLWFIEVNSPDYLSDFWHIVKSAMVWSICAAIACLMPYPVISFVLLGCSWNIVFNLFYNHILNRK
jgi:hypothetical protein